MRLEQFLYLGQDLGGLGLIAAGAGSLDGMQPSLHPLRLSRVELRAVRCEYAHLARLVRAQRIDDTQAFVECSGESGIAALACIDAGRDQARNHDWERVLVQ